MEVEAIRGGNLWVEQIQVSLAFKMGQEKYWAYLQLLHVQFLLLFYSIKLYMHL
jgi:hypothetical protein